jgi:hypothetical protein
MEKALKYMREGKSLREAARLSGVKRSTLSDRRRNIKPRNLAHESQQLLQNTQERVVVRFALDLDDYGLPPRLTHVRKLILILARENDPRITKVGCNYFERFIRRHPSVQAKMAARLDKQRALNSNYYVITDYNRKLRRLLERHKFKPWCILNFDEKGFLIGLGTKVTVLCRSKRKSPHLLQDGNRELITVVEVILADGTFLPPFIIFKGKSHTEGMYQFCGNLFPGCKIAYSDRGYIDSELSLVLLQHIVENLPLHDGEPRLLIMDGHVSHITYDFLRFCLDREIYPLIIPSHTSHILQPLDVGLFGPYGKKYSQVFNYL